MRFLSLEKETFGMDLSDLSIKILKLKEKNGKFQISSFGTQSIEPGVIEGGEIKDEEKLSFFIKEALKNVKGEKIKTKYVVCCLPEEKSFLQVILMPRMPDEDLASAILFEAENYLPISLDKVYFDWEKIPSSLSSQTIEVLICAFPKEIADSYLRALKRANLEPIAFEIESMALARALISEKEKDSCVLILDIGETRTTLAIFSKNSIRFTLTIPISGKILTELISKNLGISFAEAENLKRKSGLGDVRFHLKYENLEKTFKIKKREVFDAVLPALVDLSQQIKKTITFFETHEQKFSPREKVQKIIISGGGANLKGLREFLELQLGLPVEFGNPLSNISLFKEIPFSFEELIGLSTAIGLAQRK